MRNFLLVTILLVFASFFAASAQNYQVHSVYIYSYMKYIKWPESSENEPFKLGVLGDSEATPFLEKMAATKKAGNKSIELVKLPAISGAIVNSLDMLLIPEGELDSLDLISLSELAREESIVLITEEEHFPRGGHINFVKENSKLFFELDRHALESAGLRIASELVALARPVN